MPEAIRGKTLPKGLSGLIDVMAPNPELEKKFVLKSNISVIKRKHGCFICLRSNKRVLLLNEIGFSILELCNREHSVNDMLMLLREKYPKVSVATLKSDLFKFLDKMEGWGVIST